MTFWQRWLKQPQSLWVRKLNFQIHLWTGIGAGLYIIVVSLTGSVLVFRPELSQAVSRRPVITDGPGTPLNDEQVREVVARNYPGFVLSDIYRVKESDAPIEVWLDRGPENRKRFIHPYTGADIGPTVSLGMKVVDWMLELHDNLFAGETGRLVNGIGGLLLTLLAITGAVIWWPGIKNWRRGLTPHQGVSWKRFTWDLHSAIGFWTVALVFMFAFTGFYLVYQEWFTPIVDYIEPLNEETFEPRLLDDILVWLPRLHFGRFRQLPRQLALAVKIFWVIVGLAPAVLFVTGGLMWWNRLVRKAVISAPAPELQSASVRTQ